MSRRKRKHEESGGGGSPAWMTTFSDMMTLLLVFFVLLYSFSEMDMDRFRGFISALQSRLGVLDGGMTVIDEAYLSRGSRGEDFNPSESNLSRVMAEITDYVDQRQLQQRVQTEMSERGLTVRMTGEILYDLGRAEIKTEGERVLDAIADSVKEIPNHVIVEGHTDNLPINNERFPSNWELSTTRATNVVKYLKEEHGIEASRMSAAGYSEYRPLVPNDSSENRAQNRRVEVVILR